MGKVRQKNHKPDEHLLGIVREQKLTIKKLLQRIKQLEKELGYNQYKDHSSKKSRNENEADCKECGKGYLKEIILANRRFLVCQTCSWRSVVQKI